MLVIMLCAAGVVVEDWGLTVFVAPGVLSVVKFAADN